MTITNFLLFTLLPWNCSPVISFFIYYSYIIFYLFFHIIIRMYIYTFIHLNMDITMIHFFIYTHSHRLIWSSSGNLFYYYHYCSRTIDQFFTSILLQFITCLYTYIHSNTFYHYYFPLLFFFLCTFTFIFVYTLYNHWVGLRWIDSLVTRV